jgi:general secretion pathway protein M
VLGGAAVLAAALFYLAVWEPMGERRQVLAERVDQQREQLAWLRDAAAEVRTRGPTGDARKAAGGASLLSLVERSAGEAGLAASVRRLAPEGEHGVRGWLGDAPYRATVRWLEALERLGITPSAVQMERDEGSGRVEARLLLDRAA